MRRQETLPVELTGPTKFVQLKVPLNDMAYIIIGIIVTIISSQKKKKKIVTIIK